MTVDELYGQAATAYNAQNFSEAAKLYTQLFAEFGQSQEPQVRDVLKRSLFPRASSLFRAKDFALTAEELSKFEFSDKPIKVSDIATRLNALRPSEGMRTIGAMKITSWLLGKGFLATEPKLGYEKNKDTRVATKSGIALGISTLTATGQNGTYKFNLYNKKAQQFIVANLGEIVAG